MHKAASPNVEEQNITGVVIPKISAMYNNKRSPDIKFLSSRLFTETLKFSCSTMKPKTVGIRTKLIDTFLINKKYFTSLMVLLEAFHEGLPAMTRPDLSSSAWLALPNRLLT